jgi:hypothetical protein
MIAEGKAHKEALRCLKRRISDSLYARLPVGARRAALSVTASPGGQSGNDSDSSVVADRLWPEQRGSRFASRKLGLGSNESRMTSRREALSPRPEPACGWVWTLMSARA